MSGAIYTRVSTADQNAELQSRDLTAHAARQGWDIVEMYVMSGAKASRPALNRLMTDTHARRFDCRLVWKFDRFGRSLVDCLNNIRALADMVSGSLPSPRTWIPISRTRRPGSCYTCWVRLRSLSGR